MTTATKPNKTKMFFLRTTEEERAKLDSLADTLGYNSASKLIRSRFPEVFPPSSTSTSRPKARRAPKTQNGYVDLAEWLAERTGRPKAVLRHAIQGGRLWLAGEVVTDLRIPRSQLDAVLGGAYFELDGKPLT